MLCTWRACDHAQQRCLEGCQGTHWVHCFQLPAPIRWTTPSWCYLHFRFHYLWQRYSCPRWIQHFLPVLERQLLQPLRPIMGYSVLARLHQHSHAQTVLDWSRRLDFWILHSLHMILRWGNGWAMWEDTFSEFVRITTFWRSSCT